jgi:hypothetical protein
MKTRRWLAFLSVAACACLALRATAEDTRKEDPKETSAKATAEAVRQLGLAQELATRGREHKSPLDLLAAAEIFHTYKDVEYADLKKEPKVEGKAGEGEAKVDEALSNADQAANLLRDATALAAKLAREGTLTEKDAAAIDALAKCIANAKTAPRTRGAIGGPKRKSNFLYPGQTHTYRIDYDGWSMARVFVSSEGRSPLRVWVTNLDDLERGEDAGWSPSVSWMPGRRVGGVFVIRVQNIGDYGTPYRLVTN